jgi:hypothetical protein
MSGGVRTCALALVLLTSSVAGTSAPNNGSDTELARLRARVEQLQDELDSVKARIDAIEASGSPTARSETRGPPVSVGPTEPRAATPGVDGWARISQGMHRTEAEALLGPPTRELSIDGKLVWYYVYPKLGRGSLFFDGNGRVSSYQSPRPW